MGWCLAHLKQSILALKTDLLATRVLLSISLSALRLRASRSLRLVVGVVHLCIKVGLLGGCSTPFDLTSLSAFLLDGGLQLHVGLLLDGLCRLQLLNQLHLEHLHLHHLLLCLRNRFKLLFNLLLDLHAGFLDFSSFCLLDLLSSNLLLHLNGLLLVCVLLGNVLHLLLQAGLVLLSLELRLGSLFGLRVLDGLDDLFLLLLVHEAHAHVLLNHHLFLEFFFLGVLDLLGDSFVVTLLKAHNVGRTLLGLLNLLPSTHFLLLKQSNTVS